MEKKQNGFNSLRAWNKAFEFALRHATNHPKFKSRFYMQSKNIFLMTFQVGLLAKAEILECSKALNHNNGVNSNPTPSQVTYTTQCLASLMNYITKEVRLMCAMGKFPRYFKRK